jgi:hypothetical protein
VNRRDEWSEGIHDATGAFLAEKLGTTEVDSRGQKLLGLAAGPAAYLGEMARFNFSTEPSKSLNNDLKDSYTERAETNKMRFLCALCVLCVTVG